MEMDEDNENLADIQSAAHYKQKYKGLKRKLQFLIYEQECFVDELKSTQKKMLRVARDKSFLLDRLLQLEKFEDSSSSDSDATGSSDNESKPLLEKAPVKRKRTMSFPDLPPVNDEAVALANTSTDTKNANLAKTKDQTGQSKKSNGPTVKKRAKTVKKEKSGKKGSQQPLYAGILTREEIERQLDAKKPVMGIEKAQATLPMEIFSNDNSLQHGDISDMK